MEKFKIVTTHRILDGYVEVFYDVDAETYDEAIESIENGGIEPLDTEYYIEETEFIKYENENI